MSMTQTYQGALRGDNVTSLPTAQREQVNAEHPTVLAVLALAEYGVDTLVTDAYHAIARGLLGTHDRFIDVIADDLRTAVDYEVGNRGSSFVAAERAETFRDSALTNARMAVSLHLRDQRSAS